MAVKVSVTESDGAKTLTIGVTGRLDIYSYGEFSAAYKDHIGDCAKTVIDMSELEYIDSSALGMLLMLRERAGGAQAAIEIVNCSPAVRKILATVKFDKLFGITPG